MTNKPLILFLFTTFLFSLSLATPSVIINKGSFSVEDIDKEVPLKIYRLEWLKYKERESWINRKILKQESIAKKMTVNELLYQNVDSKIIVSNKEIEDYYNKYKQWMSGTSLIKAEDYIRKQLSQKKQIYIFEEYLNQLMKKYNVVNNLKPPNPIEIMPNPIRSYSKGPIDAPVTIVVFSDYECNACSYFHSELDQLFEKNKNNLRIIFRHDIVATHQFSKNAAIAALCAGEQNKFWEYTDVLFENQENLDADSLIDYAKIAKIDLSEFKQCIQDNLVEKILQADMNEVDRLGIEKTPAIFINGHFTDSVPSPREIQKMIDELVKNKIK